MDPMPRQAGVVVAGVNPVAVDLTCACLMGFDYRRLPILHRAFDEQRLKLTDFELDQILCMSNDSRFCGSPDECGSLFPAFAPHFGWKGHLERQYDAHAAPLK